MYNFKILNSDTDSFTTYKENFEEFSQQEREGLLKELNLQCPKGLTWEDDGYYHTIIVLAAKNYILYDGEKLKIKGSGLKDAKKEQALKDFQKDIIWAIINNESQDQMRNIYNKYVLEASNITSIQKWSSKKTVTDKTFSSERANETKVKDAIQGTEYREADKIWTYFKEDMSLGLAENFDGNYNKKKMYEKLYKSTLIFESVLPVKDIFLNYSLKKNKKNLETLVSIIDTKKVS